MTAQNFVEEKLRSLKANFTDIQIRYEYIPETKSHLVKIIPSDFMQGHEDYFKEEARIVDEFEQLFPSESIDFISDDSSIKIEDADLELGVDKKTEGLMD
jgi:hypothetical protein